MGRVPCTHTLLYSATPVIATNIPNTLYTVTGFLRNTNDVDITIILLVALTTEYPTGERRERIEKDTILCMKLITALVDSITSNQPMCCI